MMINVHMQDQVHNKVKELMNEKKNNHYDWDEIFQNLTVFSLIFLLMTVGLSW